jgi:hypothetical protein
MKTNTTIEDITSAGHDEEDAPKVLALCQHLDCTPDDLSKERHDYYGLDVFSYGQSEYAIGTDEEADSAAYQNIHDNAWAFNASFILSECDLPRELEEAIQAMQEKQCESANDAIVAMIEKCSVFQDFVNAAVSADGRGHFLSSYDGEENEETVDGTTFYIYRTN